jgi:hypothetical protein
MIHDGVENYLAVIVRAIADANTAINDAVGNAAMDEALRAVETILMYANNNGTMLVVCATRVVILTWPSFDRPSEESAV